MATLNYAFRELSCKIVYYGCGLCGKTTNLIFVHKTVPQKFRGELVSLATEQDRTLFFDFLPLDLGEVKGFKTKFQLYTVPGQVYYNATRKLVLRGVDGLVFVVDSQKDRLQENLDSLENLKQNLAEYGLHLQNSPDDVDGIPWVLQYNKRDMPQVATIEELERVLNTAQVPTYEAVAVSGQGVKDTLKGISSLVIKRLNAEAPSAGSPAPAAAKPKAVAPVAAPSSDEFSPMTAKDDDVAAAPAPATPKAQPVAPPKPASKPAPVTAAPTANTPPPAAAAPSVSSAFPQLNIQKTSKARVRGLGLGTANLTIQNLVGGEADQYQISGKVTFLAIFGGAWNRKIRYKGTESKNDGTSSNFLKFTSDDGQMPELEVWIKEDDSKDLYITYVGSGGQVEIVPNGKNPLS